MEHKLYYFLFHFFFFRLGINKKHRAFASLFFTADTSVLKSRFMFHFSSWIEPKQQRNYFLSLSFIINLVTHTPTTQRDLVHSLPIPRQYPAN